MSWFWIAALLVLFLGLMEQIGEKNKAAGRAAWVVFWSAIFLVMFLILHQLEQWRW